MWEECFQFDSAKRLLKEQVIKFRLVSDLD
jgi:hypothetical protein